jgi:hypothetical protein
MVVSLNSTIGMQLSVLLVFLQTVTAFAVINDSTATIQLAGEVRDRYDSVTYLRDEFPGSPMIVGYRSVKCVDSSYRAWTKEQSDTLYDHEIDILTINGNMILAHYSSSFEVMKTSDGKSACLVLHPFKCHHESSYTQSSCKIVDVMNSVGIDSGGYVMSISNPGVFRITRETLGSGRCDFHDANYYRVGKGMVFEWSDPTRLQVYDYFRHDSQLVFVIQESDYRFRLIDIEKKQFCDQVFTRIAGPLKRSLTDARDLDTLHVSVVEGAKTMGVFDLSRKEMSYPAANVLNANGLQWWACPNQGEQCIDRMQLTSVENRHPSKSIQSAEVVIELSSQVSGEVLYRKKNFVVLNLAPGEVGPSRVFWLPSEIWLNGPVYWRAEFVSYR